jgi:hypothetical protein
VVGVTRGEVQVVQDCHDRRIPSEVQVVQEVEHLDLVRYVEERRRLVEQQEVGLLGQRHSEPHPLPLAARQVVDGAVGEVQDVSGLEGGRHGVIVLGRPLPEPALVRIPAAADQVRHPDALGGPRRLRKQAHGQSDLPGRESVDRLAVEEHAPGGGSQQPGETA